MSKSADSVSLAPYADLVAPPVVLERQGALLGVIPLGLGSQLAVVGYLLPGARQDARLRPAGQPADGLVVDAAQHRALVNGRDIGLVYREFELLAFRAARPYQAFTRAHLLETVWGAAYQGSTRTVDVHIHRLRRKLGPEYRQCLVTMRHLGYLYQPPSGSAALTPASSGNAAPGVGLEGP